MTRFGVAVLALACGAAPAMARTVEVKMLNQGPAGIMVFEPGFVRIAPGDSVTFTPTSPGHNAVSLPTMTPTGGETFQSGFNQPVTVRFTKDGVYGYKCTPHAGLGMVGVIQVGKPVNLDAAKAAAAALPPLAKARMTGYLAQVH